MNVPLVIELTDVPELQRLTTTKPTEFDYANNLATQLPPIRTCGADWHAYENGCWHIIDRARFRPIAQNVLPPDIRTDRRANALLDDLEGRFQKSADSFTGFYRFNADSDILLNCQNGIVRVTQDGVTTLEPHNPDCCFTLAIAAKFTPDADAPLFRRVLSEALPDDDDRQLYQLFAGNVLLPDSRFETALVAYGEAGRGKSTCAEPIAEALGREIVPRLSMSQICDGKSYHVPKLRYAAVNLGTRTRRHRAWRFGGIQSSGVW